MIETPWRTVNSTGTKASLPSSLWRSRPDDQIPRVHALEVGERPVGGVGPVQVVAGASADVVRAAVATHDDVVAVAAEQPVVAPAAVDEVVAAVADEDVGGGAGG